jgi:hypothetical protein
VDAAALAGWNGVAHKRMKARLQPGKALHLWVLRERAAEFNARVANEAAASPHRAAPQFPKGASRHVAPKRH